MSFNADTVASILHAARLAHQTIAPLPADIAPQSVADGAAAQLALACLLGALPPAGFKIGATGQRMQEYLGLREPAAGFMVPGDVHLGCARLPYAELIRPGVECEVGVRLARDLPFGLCSLDTVRDAVGEIFAAIEIVENRYDDLHAVGTPTLIADQVYHCAAVVGDPGDVAWRSLDLAALRGRICLDGTERDAGMTADLMGHPFHCLTWLARSSVAAAFNGLKAGQVVMLGSVTPPVWLDGPASVTVEFPPLPMVSVVLF